MVGPEGVSSFERESRREFRGLSAERAVLYTIIRNLSFDDSLKEIKLKNR